MAPWRSGPVKVKFANRPILVYLPRRGSAERLPLQLRACGLTNLIEANRPDQIEAALADRAVDLILIAHFGPAPETAVLTDRLKTGDRPIGPPLAAVIDSAEVDRILRLLSLGIDRVLVDPFTAPDLEILLAALLDPESARPPGARLIERGWRYIHENEPDRARGQFDDLIFDPNLGFDARLGLFEIEFSARSWAGAEGQLDRAGEAAGRTGDPVQRRLRSARVQFLRGRLHLARGAIEAAEACHRRALELHPYSAPDLTALIDLLDLTGRTEEAPDLIVAAGETFPPFAPGLAALADGVDKVCRRLRRQGESDRADRLYLALAGLAHGNDRVNRRTLDYLVKAELIGRMMETIEPTGETDYRLDRLMADLPDHPGALLLSARRLLRSDRAIEATVVLQRALAGLPRNRELLAAMDEACRALGRADRAAPFSTGGNRGRNSR